MRDEKNLNVATEATEVTEVTSIEATLAEIINKRTGKKYLTEEHIHSDERGWYYYIPEKSVPTNCVLFLKHYRGPFFVVIPTEDFAKLKDGSLDAEDYVDNANWYFGHFSGGGSMLYGASWMKLYEGTGLIASEKVHKFLHGTSCIVANRVSGCTFESEDYDTGIEAIDRRVDFAKALADYIGSRFGFKVSYFMSTGFSCIEMVYSYSENEVMVNIPEEILSGLLYDADSYSDARIEEIIENLEYCAKIPWKYVKDKVEDGFSRAIETREDAIKLWTTKDERFNWYKQPGTSTEVDSDDLLSGEAKTFLGKFFERVAKFCK